MWAFLILIIAVITLTKIEAAGIKESISYPKAKKERYEQIIHGDTNVDYYNWLKGKNWPTIDDKEIINYLKEENQFTDDYFFLCKKQEDKLIEEIKRKVKDDDETYPKKIDNYYYYRKFIKGYNHFIVCRKKTP